MFNKHTRLVNFALDSTGVPKEDFIGQIGCILMVYKQLLIFSYNLQLQTSDKESCGTYVSMGNKLRSRSSFKVKGQI